MRKLILTIFISLIWNSISFAEQKCSDFIDFEWEIKKPVNFDPYNPTHASFVLKSKSTKDIIIREVRLWTKDKENVVAESRNLDLKSFRVLKTRIILKDVNLDVIKYGAYICSFKDEGNTLGGAYKTKFEGYLFETGKDQIFDNKKRDKGTFKNILGKYLGK